jgi:type I restriction enzyme S subunit
VKSQFIELISGANLLPISEVCDSYSRGKSPNYVNNSLIKVINQACIYWDGLRLQNVKYQDESRFKSANRLKAGAVLLNATGTGTLGRSYVFEEKDVKRLKFNKKLINDALKPTCRLDSRRLTKGVEM